MKKNLVLLVVLATAMVMGCTSEQAAPLPVAAVAPAPVLPERFYSIRDGLEYGYAPAITANEKNDGRVASKLMMFSYLGTKGDAHQVMLSEGDVSTVAECEKPCEFAKIYTFVSTKFVKKEILQLAEGAILQLVFADAMRGKLTRLSVEQSGKQVGFWVDSETKKFVVSRTE